MTDSQTLLSILVAESWFYDGGMSCVKFRADRTGELWYGGEQFLTISHEFDWEALDPKALEQVIDNNRGKGVQCLAYLSLEITLTERLALRDERFGKMLEAKDPGQHPFTEDAFRPKTYTIRLESGTFALPFTVANGDAEKFQDVPKYALRLVFDKSPYPSPEEWKRPQDAGGYEWKEFVSRENSLSTTWPGNCLIM